MAGFERGLHNPQRLESFKYLGSIFLKFAIVFVAVKAGITPARSCFDDVILSKLALTSRPSLVYVWSPRMVLSVTQAHLAAEQAKTLGLQFVPVVDGRLPASEWQAALRKMASTPAVDAFVLSASEPLCSAQLIGKDAYLHFPTAFVLQNGQIHPQKLVGAMPAHFWRKGIMTRLDAPLASVMVSIPAATQVPIPVPAPVPAEQCIPQNQFIALDPKLAGLDDNQEVALGAYERISPDGRFVLRSYSGKRLTAVSLVELPGPQPMPGQPGQSRQQRIFDTPFENEAFPVQGSWRYLVDTNGDHYEFSSILRHKTDAKPLFKGGMTGFYAAAAEVGSTYPVRTTGPIRIRSLSWPNAAGSAETQGEGMLTSRTLTVDPVNQRIVADSGRVNLCLERVATDGPMYALPMISVDGHEFAALPQMPVAGVPTMRIFGFGANGQQCEPHGQFTSQSGKVIFGFSGNHPKKLADVAYEYRGQAWWYQRDQVGASATPFNLAPWEDGPNTTQTNQRSSYKNVLASAFPGITRDGRVIYAATWKRCAGTSCTPEGGYVVADPYQSNAYKNHVLQTASGGKVSTKTCITLQDVARERAAFAAFHGIEAAP